MALRSQRRPGGLIEQNGLERGYPVTRKALSFDLLSGFPLTGRTHKENEDVAIACVTLRRLLSDHPRVTEWREAIVPDLVAQMEETGRINPDPLFESAAQLCRGLGLPSALIAHEIYIDTWTRVFAEVKNVHLSEIVWAAPGNENGIRQSTDDFLVELLRSAADAIEGGFNSDIPWYNYRDSIKRNLVQLASGAIRFSRTLDGPPGRHRTNAAIKAEALFRVEVGDENGKPSVRQVADDLVRSGDLGPDAKNARRTLHEWLADMRRLLRLRPPTL